MPCSKCDAKVICIETTLGPVSQSNSWYEEGLGWHCHFPKGFSSTQVFECVNGHKYVENWTPSCKVCSTKSK